MHNHRKTLVQSRGELRNNLIEEIKREFLGPGSEEIENGNNEYERISESPLRRYFMGVLYAQKSQIGETDIENGIENPSFEDTDEENDIAFEEELTQPIKSGNDDQYEDSAARQSNEYCPSSYGITFYLGKGKSKILIKATAAKYERLTHEESYVELSPNENFINDLDKNECFEINDNKLFYKTYITKENRQHIIDNCNKLYLSSLPEELRDKIINPNDNVKKDDELRYYKSRGYLIFSRAFDKAKNLNLRGYKRIPCKEFLATIDLDKFNENITLPWENEKIIIRVTNRPTDHNGIKKITITAVNIAENKENNTKYDGPELSYFQNNLQISTLERTKLIDNSKLKMNTSRNDIDDLLYRNKKIFATGHGCSVNWNGNNPNTIYSVFLPTYEVPKTSPNPRRISELNLELFSMKKLAFEDLYTQENLIEDFTKFVNDYESWSNEKDESLNQRLSGLLEENRQEIDRIIKRLREGIKLLNNNNKKIITAFRLANLAMLMQRANTVKYFSEDSDLPDLENDFDAYRNLKDSFATWRPFQIIFILLNIKSIVEPESEDRKIADLLWFPTGGGKTEAYLGVIAFTIFYRRLDLNNKSLGTAVIMRYTLRLLTSQQFQRAATLIMACDLIRRKNENLLGKDEISIGLWVGADNTPNKNEDAVKILKKLFKGDGLDTFTSSNPFQISECPWCGHSLLNKKKPILSGYSIRPKFHLKCINSDCAFNDSLPIQVVDELLYENPTTLLFATVDKFARMAWNEQTRSIFGILKSERGIERINKPPDLILQDELHLIAGPLGSMFGLYETIIDFLSTENGITPKIICSTATVKRANEQIQYVFNRDTVIFPPALKDIENSYFSVEIPVDVEPGRMYLGLMSVGQTQESSQVKSLYTLLYNNYPWEYNEEFADTYYTIVSYYNSIRELGKAASLLNEDVKEKIKMLQDRKREIVFRPLWYNELTSRISSHQLPIILKKLERLKFNQNNIFEAVPIVLSSNMFSVGVDVSRLNLMLVNGQPKSTSEYIQATSRVGRKDPGLVVALFNGFKPRDRSHYENFKAYHSSFYRFVEPTGVTPFSIQSRSRALHSLLVIYIRLLTEIGGNKDACNFSRDLVSKEFIEFFINRIKAIDPDETDNALKELFHFMTDWENKKEELVYTLSKYHHDDYPLIRDYGSIRYTNERDAWPVLQSLRNVDIPTLCKLEN